MMPTGLDGAFSADGLMMASVLLRLRPPGILEEFPENYPMPFPRSISFSAMHTRALNMYAGSNRGVNETKEIAINHK